MVCPAARDEVFRASFRWLIKNTAWSHDFLVRWWHSEILQGPGENHNCGLPEGFRFICLASHGTCTRL